MIKLQQITTLLFILSITSCSLLGPDYTKPDVKPSANWNSGLSNTTESSSIISGIAWWQQFNDPTLNKMIDISLQNNNNIQIAIGNILQASAELEKVHMAWVPTINLGGGACQWKPPCTTSRKTSIFTKQSSLVTHQVIKGWLHWRSFTCYL